MWAGGANDAAGVAGDVPEVPARGGDSMKPLREWFGQGIMVGVGLVLLLLALGWSGAGAKGQDLSTDLALLTRGTIPQVAVTVDAATTFAVSPRFPWAYISLACTDAESIDTITGGRTGLVLYIAHTDTDCTLNDDETATAANAIDLTGAATDVGAAKKVIALIYNGDSWEELFESDN